MKCECGKELPEAAVKDQDPYCSRACACAAFGTEWPAPTEVTPSNVSNYGGHSRMLMPSDSKTLTRLQRARINADRLARVREGLKVR